MYIENFADEMCEGSRVADNDEQNINLQGSNKTVFRLSVRPTE